MSRVKLNGYDIQSSKMLTEEESNYYFDRLKNGDKEAKNILIMSNIKLVLSITQRYYSNKVDIEDMFHVGIIGLIKAIDGFDTSYNVKFSTYAVPMIMGDIRRFAKDNLGIKVPRALRDIAFRAISFKKEYEQTYFKEPTFMEIADEIGVLEKDVYKAFDAVSDAVSLNDVVYSNGEDSLTLMDQIKDDKMSEEKLMNKILLQDGLKKLPKKEQQVIYLRYFLGKTQCEISRFISISQAQVSRLEQSAIDKLRDYICV